jgi:hypothetical protein
MATVALSKLTGSRSTQANPPTVVVGRRPGRPASGKKNVIVTLSLPEVTYAEIKDHAQLNGIFPGQVVAEAVAAYLHPQTRND